MPNHVISEVIFRNVDLFQQEAILAKALGVDGKVDFETLLPIPINVWVGNVSLRHEQRLKNVALIWCRDNWGTKWNAYDHHPIERGDDFLILRFETAWNPPYGWLVALHNTFKLPFEHNWLSESGAPAQSDRWNYALNDEMTGDPWQEKPADEAMSRHLHKLLWGVEEFPDEPEDEDEAGELTRAGVRP